MPGVAVQPNMNYDASPDQDEVDLAVRAAREFFKLGLDQLDDDSWAAFHRALACLLRATSTRNPIADELDPALHATLARMSQEWISHEKRRLPEFVANQPHLAWAPTDLDSVGSAVAECFNDWFAVALASTPARNNLYSQLAESAERDDLAFFMGQERTVDASFADFLAMTQVGASGQSKRVIVRNLWDEVGAGRPDSDHLVLFRNAQESVTTAPCDLLPEAHAAGNLFHVLARYRTFYFESIGALVVTEGAVPWRFENVVRAVQRLCLPPAVHAYYAEHVEADGDHASDWASDVVIPEIMASPAVADRIIEGALLRLAVSERYCSAVLKMISRSNRAVGATT